MAKINVRNQYLFDLEQQYQQLQGSLLGIINSSKLRQFWNDNNLRIKTAHEKQREIFEEFYFIEETGKLKMESEDKDAKPLLREGKTHEEFTEKLNNFLTTQNVLEI